MQNYLPACKIVSTHGVRGEMKALPLCDGAAFLAKFKRLFTTADGAGETRVLGVRAQGNVILLRLDGVNDMDAARAQGRERLSLLLEAIYATGIRVSEAWYITVEAARESPSRGRYAPPCCLLNCAASCCNMPGS